MQFDDESSDDAAENDQNKENIIRQKSQDEKQVPSHN